MGWHSLPHACSVFNLVALLSIAIVTTILVIGIKESANFNTVVVFIKLAAVLIFIAVAGNYVMHHMAEAKANWTPFIPPNTGQFGIYGWSGIPPGPARVFFACFGLTPLSPA